MDHHRASDEQGAALISVIGVTFVLTVLVATMLVTVINLNRSTYRDADFHAALGAAEAGVDDLVFALNADPAYWEDIRDGTADRPGFAGWTGLPGEGDGGEFRYEATSFVEQDGTIEVKVSGRVGDRVRTLDVMLRRRNFLDYLYFTEYETRPPAAYNTWPPLEDDNETRRALPGGGWANGNLDGNVEVAFVGEAAQAKATEQCAWHRYDSGRPADAPTNADPNLVVPTGITYPEVPAPDGDPAHPDGRNPKCHEPHWVDPDDFDGPLHSNDSFPIRSDGGDGPIFRGPATSSWAGAPDAGFLDIRGLVNGGAASPATFVGQAEMLYDQPLRMPPSNDQLRQVAANDGCLLRGPTRLHLHIHNDRGAIGINSPLSPNEPCGDSTTLDGNGHARVYVDDISNGVLFVENAVDDQNLGQGSAADLPMEGVAGVDIPDWDAGLDREDVTPYFQWHGDALVSGELEGRLTIGAGHDLIIVGDVTYRGTNAAARDVPDNDDTLLGLIANRFVYLFNPVACRYRWNHETLERADVDEAQWVCLHGRSINYNGDGGDGGGLQDPRVYGAILSVQYSLTIQNSGLGGGKGRLYVIGAIGQQYRGNLGTAPGGYYLEPGIDDGARCRANAGSFGGVTGGFCGAGYSKEFTYDTRLRYLSPPHFLSPLETAWRVADYSEAEVELFE